MVHAGKVGSTYFKWMEVLGNGRNREFGFDAGFMRLICLCVYLFRMLNILRFFGFFSMPRQRSTGKLGSLV